MEKKFLIDINKKFSCKAKETEDAHRDPKPYGSMDEIICWRYERKLKNDWSAQFNREYFQVREPKEKAALQPQALITIKKYLDGSLGFWHKDKLLTYNRLSRKPEPPSRSKKYYVPTGPVNPAIRSQLSRQNKHKSPWSRTPSDWLKSSTHSAVQKKTAGGQAG